MTEQAGRRSAGRARPFSAPPRDMEATPFSAILGDFLARLPGAIAVALVDSGGETVDYAGKYDLFELKVMAAHFRILLGTAGVLVGEAAPPRSLVVRARTRSILALLAPDGYAVVVVLGRRAGFARHEIAADRMMQALAQEAGWALEGQTRWEQVEVRRDRRGRPLELLMPRPAAEGLAGDAAASSPLEVLGTFGTNGYRVRRPDGHEFSLVREPKNAWYCDTRLTDPAAR